MSVGPGDEEPTFRVGPDSDPDRYVLGVAVGGGAEGIVYRGSITTATGLQLEVAIKMLQPQYIGHVEQWHIRWMEQVELLRSLQVPGVVPVRDGFLGPLPHALGQPGAGRTLYLVMNWVEGESLDEWVRHRTDRDPLDDLKVLLPVAAALDLMHSGRATGGVPIVHRDVKPSNVIVTGDRSVLVDFGLTRGLPSGQRLTGVAGTPGYLAPESYDGGVYSPSSDRYAFGGVAHFVVSGSEPPTDHRPDVFRTQLEAVPALKDRPEVVDHLMEMVAADPDARPTGLANWIAQLRRSSLEAGPDLLNPLAPHRHPESRKRSWTAKVRRDVRRPRAFRHRVLVFAVVLVVLISAGTIAAITTASGPTSSNSPAKRIPSLGSLASSDSPLLTATDLDSWKWTYSPLPTYDQHLGRSWYGGSTPLPADLTYSSPAPHCVAAGGLSDPTPEKSSFASYAPADVIPTLNGWLAVSERIDHFKSAKDAIRFETYVEQEGQICRIRFPLPAGLSSASSCPGPGVTQLASSCRVATDWFGQLSPIHDQPRHLCDSSSSYSAPTGAAGPKGKFYISYIRCGSAVGELDVLAGVKSGFGQPQLTLFTALAAERLRNSLNMGGGPQIAPTTDQVNTINNVALTSMGTGWKNNGVQQWWLDASPQSASGWDLTSCDRANLDVFRTYEEGNMATYSSSAQMVRAKDKYAAISTNTLYFSEPDDAVSSFDGYDEYRQTCPSNLVQAWNPNPMEDAYDPSRVGPVTNTPDQSFINLSAQNQCEVQNQCQITVNDLSFHYSAGSPARAHRSTSGLKIYWIIGIVQYGNSLLQVVESDNGNPPDKAQFRSVLQSQIDAMKAVES